MEEGEGAGGRKTGVARAMFYPFWIGSRSIIHVIQIYAIIERILAL